MEDVIIITSESATQPVQEPLPGAGPEVASGDHQRLEEEIRPLWAAHVEAKAAARRAKADLKDIRRRLAGPLAEMKGLLAKPGRNGGWSAFLRSEGIAKATAERLARKGLESGDIAAEAAGLAPHVPEGGDANPADSPAADPDPQVADDAPATATQEPPGDVAATATDTGPQELSDETAATLTEPVQAAAGSDVGVSGGGVATL